MRRKGFHISGSVVIFFALAIYWWISRPLDEAFYVPEDFEGCASIVYDIQGVSALEVKNHTIQYHLDKDGILLTSSPADFGWEGQTSSGFHTTEYYYVNKNGKASEIPIEHIGQGTLGEYSENGRVRLTRYAVPIGNKEMSCEDEYYNLDKLVDEKLNKK
ncbi:hypothetical protein HNO89_004207 [Sporosarcina luteola]|nr:hypothetical protein [Sporosarcina luteola]